MHFMYHFPNHDRRHFVQDISLFYPFYLFIFPFVLFFFPLSKAAPPPYFFKMSRPIFKFIVLLGGLLPFRGDDGEEEEGKEQAESGRDSGYEVRTGWEVIGNEMRTVRVVCCTFVSFSLRAELATFVHWSRGLCRFIPRSLASEWPEICGCMRPDTSMAVISGLGHSLDFWLRDVEAVERPWPWMRARSTSDHGWELGARRPRSSSDHGCKWEEREQPYL